MAEQCAFYYYDSSFFVSNSYCCRLLQDKEREYRVGEDWANQYCKRYNHEKCPYYNNRGDISSGSSGCFLTSACVRSKGLPDDCYELQLLRRFRDTYMKSFDEGKKAVQEYYSVAPLLVQKIDQQSNSSEIYERIYRELIVPCISLIEKGEKQNAYRQYREYTNRLLKEFTTIALY